MEASLNPVSLLSRGTLVTRAAFSAVVVLLIIFALMVILIRKRVRRKRLKNLSP